MDETSHAHPSGIAPGKSAADYVYQMATIAAVLLLLLTSAV
jgi:hypothetical protein